MLVGILLTHVILCIVNAVEFECPSEIGLFPKPGDCRSFYKCFAWEAGLVSCPDGLLFHPEHKLCDWQENVDCSEFGRDTVISAPRRRSRFKTTKVDASNTVHQESRFRIPTSKSRSTTKAFFGKSAIQLGRNVGNYGYTQVKSHKPKIKDNELMKKVLKRIENAKVHSTTNVEYEQGLEAKNDRVSNQNTARSNNEVNTKGHNAKYSSHEVIDKGFQDVDLKRPENLVDEAVPQQPYSLNDLSTNLDKNDDKDIKSQADLAYDKSVSDDNPKKLSDSQKMHDMEKNSFSERRLVDRVLASPQPNYRYPKTSEEYFSITEYLLYTPVDEILRAGSSEPHDLVILKIPKGSQYNPFKGLKLSESDYTESLQGFSDTIAFSEGPEEDQNEEFKPTRRRNFKAGAGSLESGFYGYKPIRISSAHAYHRDYNPLAIVKYAAGTCDKIGRSDEPINQEIESLRAKACTASNKDVEKVIPRSKDNPRNVKLVESIFSEEDFKSMFPKANKAYTYENFLKAFSKFPEVCKTKDICKKTLATMFAHFEQETWGLHYIEEINKSDYCASHTEWIAKAYPCIPGRQYFGRGSKQLSWNYNYGAFSLAMFGDAMVLLENPDLVASTWLNFASAIWFYLTPQPPKPSMLAVVDGSWQPNEDDFYAYRDPGFGATTMIINGALECGADPPNKTASKNRQKHYRRFAAHFNLDIRGEKLDCVDMEPFDATSSSNPSIYWAPETGCKLAQWQTAYSALVEGDFERCQLDS